MAAPPPPWRPPHGGPQSLTSEWLLLRAQSPWRSCRPRSGVPFALLLTLHSTLPRGQHSGPDPSLPSREVGLRF